MVILRKVLPVTLLIIQFFCGGELYANPNIKTLNNLPLTLPASFHEILTIWDSMPPSTPFIQKCVDIGYTLHKKGENAMAIEWFQFVLPYTIYSADRFALYNGIATVYMETGNFETAAHYNIKALDYTGNSEISDQRRAIIYLNMGNLLMQINGFDKSLNYLNMALAIFKKHKDYLYTCITLDTKGMIKCQQGHYAESIGVYYDALAEISKINATKMTGKISIHYVDVESSLLDITDVEPGLLNNIANSYLMMKEADSALLYLNKIKPYFHAMSPYGQSSVEGSTGEALALKKDYPSAAYYLEQGLAEAEEGSYKDLAMQASKSLSNIYGTQGKYQKAWEHEKRYGELKDEVLSEKNLHNVDAIETKYQLTKKDKEIAETKLQVSRQEIKLKEKNFLGAFMILGIVSLCCILYISRKNYRNKQKLSEKTRKIKQVEATIKGEEKERTRIAKELHDVVASELLAMKINLKSMEQEYEVLRHSASYRNVMEQSKEIALKIRETAHNLMPVNLRKNGLYTSIHAFIKKINSRNIHFIFQAYNALPELKTEVEKIIFLIILELIQNIIKHSKATEAIIQLDYYLGTLTITIEDNGVGILSPQKETDGIGLSNVKESIAVLNATLDIKSSEYTGTTIYIEIPLEDHIIVGTAKCKAEV